MIGRLLVVSGREKERGSEWSNNYILYHRLIHSLQLNVINLRQHLTFVQLFDTLIPSDQLQ